MYFGFPLLALIAFFHGRDAGLPAMDGAGHEYPQSYFRSPIDQPLRLSGTFGELRPNHFHSGIDIKGASGQSVYAAAAGYVYRIKVEESGYGKALYLQHPNGYATVYAHLNNFTPEIEAFVKEQQYRQKSFEVDIAPGKDRFVVRSGANIGAIGNSGSSLGPHLHFEIRRRSTEKPVNPLLFGLKVPDTKAPQMRQLKVYFLNDKLATIHTRTFDLISDGDEYRLKEPILTFGAWRVGFGVKVFDQMDGAANWNGIYSLSMSAGDSLLYQFNMETFSFGETRYLNAHIDYQERVTRKSYIHRCYTLPGNHLSIYRRNINNGVVKLYESRPADITLIAKDAAGNAARLKFRVKRGQIEKSPARQPFNYVLPHADENVISNASIQLYFPKGVLYEDLYLSYQSSRDHSSNIYSAVHSVHDFRTPVHRYFDLAIRPALLSEKWIDKAFIAYCDQNDRITNVGGSWENGFLKTRVRTLGDYYIMIDRSPPLIAPVEFGEDMRNAGQMRFRITDNYSTASNVRGLTYRGTVDGQWILLEYDEKNDLLTHRFDGRIGPGKHELKLTVRDNRGNAATFSGAFLR